MVQAPMVTSCSLPPMSEPEDIAARLAVALQASSMGVQALADEIGVSYQAIKKILNGKSKSFSAENVFKAAEVLGVDPYWLATGRGPMRLSTQAAPISDTLRSAWADASPDIQRAAENAARAVLNLDSLPRLKPEEASRKRAANGA